MTAVLRLEGVDFVVRALEPTEWADLVAAHPSPDRRFRYDQATLHPALIQASVISPAVDLDFACQLADDPDVGEELIDGCLKLSAPGSLERAKRQLAAEPRLMAEVGACARMGIPHDQFLTWSPVSRDLLLAWCELKDAPTCPGCGVPQADMKKPFTWEPDVLGCTHCDTKHRAQESITEGNRHREHVVLVPAGTT
jgi:hypothetical protein